MKNRNIAAIGLKEQLPITGSLFFAFVLFCTTAVAEPVLIEEVPHIVQKPDFCGEACIAAWLQKLGHDVTQDDVFNRSGVDPALGRGCVTRDMKSVLEDYGFKAGDVWYFVDAASPEVGLEREWGVLLRDLKKDIASIICMRTSDSPTATEHFRLLLGFDPDSDEVIYHEPSERNGAYRRMKRDVLLKLWPLKYWTEKWLVIRMRLEPDKIKIGPRKEEGFTNADFAQHVMTLRQRLPQGFSFVIEPPFIVIGDESPERVKMRSVHTVKAFSDAMRRQYFPKDPPKIYEIWLFKNDRSYRKYAKELFNDEPDTPYGYCSDSHSALVMNIGTGGGTLCHEMVHAFMPSNFPQCPSWFNEGLASLYEQCQFVNGKAMGLTNWRLAGLQREIKDETLPSFNELCSTTTHQFYHSTKGNNYAQARYLLYYLQEKGLLDKYYREFHKNAKKDPTGLQALKKVLKEDDLKDFQKRWEKWVMTLRFP
jgi:hypothetical protein